MPPPPIWNSKSNTPNHWNTERDTLIEEIVDVDDTLRMAIHVRLLVRAKEGNERSEFLPRTIRPEAEAAGGGLERVVNDVGDIVPQQRDHSVGHHFQGVGGEEPKYVKE